MAVDKSLSGVFPEGAYLNDMLEYMGMDYKANLLRR